jgi:hypothetical protein
VVRATERVRQEVLAETGVDFGRYRTDELAARLDVWGLGGRVALDLVVAMAAGVGVAATIVIAAALLGVDDSVSWLVALGATAIGSGVLALVASARFVRRAADEVDTVFHLARRIAEEASEDLEKVAGSLDSVVRGLVIVSAVPLVANVASRRFLVLAPVVRRSVELVAGRALDRSLPALPLSSAHPGPMVQNLASRLTAGRQVASVGVGKAARWAVLPFRVWGVAVGTGGAVVLAIVVVVDVMARASA